jgi:cytochrome c
MAAASILHAETCQPACLLALPCRATYEEELQAQRAYIQLLQQQMGIEQQQQADDVSPVLDADQATEPADGQHMQECTAADVADA